MKNIAFISDLFLEIYVGGAELTTDAIMSYATKRNYPITASHCKNITKDVIDKNKENFSFIVCNFSSLENDVKIHMCKNASYSIIEYDYKICEYRSFELHESNEKSTCDCEKRLNGKINSAFYGYAEKVWFMSEQQKNLILEKVPALKEENCEVLSSVFKAGDLRFIHSLKDNEKNDKYIILDSDSWIKGTSDCIEYAKNNNLQFELVKGMPYHELLIKLSTSKGLIFMPLGSDTCPRLVIEAKMLGCDLILNENVQHKNEKWFSTQNLCYEHMDNRAEVFWNYYE